MPSDRSVIVFHPEPEFSKEEVSKYLKLKSWPKGMRYTVGWPEIKKMIAGGDFHSQKIASLTYLLWVLSPEFQYSKKGLYVTDFDRRFDPSKYVKQYGRFKSEAMINQIQLSKVTKNRLAQFEIACRAGRTWIHQLRQLPCRRAVIFIIGDTNYSLAVFSNPTTNQILELKTRFDAVAPLTRSEGGRFINWAL